MMGSVAGVNGDVELSTSPSTALGSAETCTDTGDHIHYVASVHQAFDPTQSLTVQDGDGTTWNTVTDYHVYWPLGMIIFNTARTVGVNDHVHISVGHYFTFSQLSGAHAWKASAKADTKDCTPFQAPQNFATYTATDKSMTFSVDCFSQDARVLNEMIKGTGATNISGGIVLCKLYWDKTNGRRFQFYALPTGVNTQVMASDLNKQSVNFQATGPVYEVLSNTFNATNVKRM
jgi:hypothetical protein